MKRYWKLYKKFFVINMALFFSYRANALNQLIASTVWTILLLGTMLLITEKAQLVAGWSQAEMLLLTGGLLMTLGLFEIHFKRSFQYMPDVILYGNLDNLLIKPVDSQFIASFTKLNPFGLYRAVIAAIFLTYVIFRFDIVITTSGLLGYFLLLLFGVGIFYSIWLFFVTLLIWFPRLSNIIDVANSMNHISRFPPEMYREFNLYIFLFLLPYMFIVSTPVKVLLQKASVLDAAVMLSLAIIMGIGSRMFWKFALRYYTSASG